MLICRISVVIVHQIFDKFSRLCLVHLVVIKGGHLLLWIDCIEPAGRLHTLKNIISSSLVSVRLTLDMSTSICSTEVILATS